MIENGGWIYYHNRLHLPLPSSVAGLAGLCNGFLSPPEYSLVPPPSSKSQILCRKQSFNLQKTSDSFFLHYMSQLNAGEPHLLLLVLLEQFLGFAVFLVQRFKLVLRVSELLIKSFAEGLSLKPVLLQVVDSFWVLLSTLL